MNTSDEVLDGKEPRDVLHSFLRRRDLLSLNLVSSIVSVRVRKDKIGAIVTILRPRQLFEYVGLNFSNHSKNTQHHIPMLPSIHVFKCSGGEAIVATGNVCYENI